MAGITLDPRITAENLLKSSQTQGALNTIFAEQIQKQMPDYEPKSIQEKAAAIRELNAYNSSLDKPIFNAPKTITDIPIIRSIVKKKGNNTFLWIVVILAVVFVGYQLTHKK